MSWYHTKIREELYAWQETIRKPPTRLNRLSKSLQRRINKIIPDRVHQAITVAIKQMTRAVLFGAEFTTRQPLVGVSIETQESAVRDRITFYKRTAAAEGGVTGAGGLLLGLADFPLLMGLKVKMLYEIAALYGYSVNDYRERLYILHIFQLAFSSQEHRRQVFEQMTNWEEKSHGLPEDIHQFDWLTFQQEYRDYIDLVKMAQLIPGIGAVVGLIANHQLIEQLGTTAMNSYRMRWEEGQRAVSKELRKDE